MDEFETRLPDEISFEQWVDHVFDHDDRDWHWKTDRLWWDDEKNSALALEFMTRLFSSPTFLKERFSSNQIGAGLWFIVNNSCSNHAFAMLDDDLPLDQRLDCINAISTLFESLLAEICLSRHSHGRRGTPPDDTAAQSLCYMFWDVIPLYARSRSSFAKEEVSANLEDHERMEAACLDAMERTLKVENTACQEAALHGLGHWANAYPEKVRPIIDAYLRTEPPAELVSYARAARSGAVL